MTLDLSLVERRMRRAYELGRLKHASLRSVPIVAITLAALYFGPKRHFDFALGLAFVATAIFYLWQGQLAARALKPSIIAGLFPLVLALAANGPNAGCHHGSTLSLCTLACALGGAIAAFRLSRFTRTEEHQPTAYGLAVIPTLLLGSLGCGCVGFSGVLAMTLALVVVSVPTMLSWARAR
jgi:hypothetical protein